MKKLFFLGLVCATLIISSVSVVSALGFSEWVKGVFSGKVVDSSITQCTDSDVNTAHPDGKSIDTKGTTKGYLSGAQTTKIDSCSGNDYVLEYYCETQNDPTGGKGYISYSASKCMNSACQDGACLQASNENSNTGNTGSSNITANTTSSNVTNSSFSNATNIVTIPICQDSDVSTNFPDGKNWLVKGTLTYGQITSKDYCGGNSGQTLYEQYCESRTSYNQFPKECSFFGYKCQDGACISGNESFVNNTIDINSSTLNNSLNNLTNSSIDTAIPEEIDSFEIQDIELIPLVQKEAYASGDSFTVKAKIKVPKWAEISSVTYELILTSGNMGYIVHPHNSLRSNCLPIPNENSIYECSDIWVPNFLYPGDRTYTFKITLKAQGNEIYKVKSYPFSKEFKIKSSVPENEDLEVEPLRLNTEKENYYLGEFITFSQIIQRPERESIDSLDFEIQSKGKIIFRGRISCVDQAQFGFPISYCSTTWNTRSALSGTNDYLFKITGKSKNGQLIDYEKNFKFIFLDLDASFCKELFPGHNSPESNRANIVFYGTGYYEHTERLRSLSEKLIDFNGEGYGEAGYGLFSVEPFKENKNKFNIWYVEKPEYVYSCLFNNRYPVQIGDSKEFAVGVTIPFDKIVLNVGSPNNEISWTRIFVHEFGHLFGNLEDEYLLGYRDNIRMPERSNCYTGTKGTKEECLRNAPWKDLIGNGCGQEGVVDCIISNDANSKIEVGCFEGCGERQSYRPTFESIMRQSSQKDIGFGLWNEKLIQEELDKFSGT